MSKRACMKVHARALLIGSLFAALVPLASAHAAAGPPGTLTPIATPQLCFAQSPAAGCTSAPGLESARAVTISADGRNLYAGGGTSISAFQRDAKTGALTQLTGALGCVSSVGCGLRARTRTERRRADRALARRPSSLCGLVHHGLGDGVRA